MAFKNDEKRPYVHFDPFFWYDHSYLRPGNGHNKDFLSFLYCGYIYICDIVKSR